MRRIVITGAPGTGKTSLVAQLEKTYTTVPEPARRVLAEHSRATRERSLDDKPELFVALLLKKSVEDFDSVDGDVVVFDRGVPDCIAYATVSGVDATAAQEASRTYRYAQTVFLAPPWREIYTKDELRRATYEQIEEFHKHVVDAYSELGYELIELPKLRVEDRAGFVERWLDGTYPSPTQTT